MDTSKKIYEYMLKKKAKLCNDEEQENPGSTTSCNEDNPCKDSSNDTETELVPDIPVLRMNENRTKKTFSELSTMRRTSVSDRIQQFQELGMGNECEIGSGRCATHNAKVVRTIMNVRKSDQNEAGVMRWRLCESTVLVCPTAHNRKLASEVELMTSQSEEGTANGNTENFLNIIQPEGSAR